MSYHLNERNKKTTKQQIKVILYMLYENIDILVLLYCCFVVF